MKKGRYAARAAAEQGGNRVGRDHWKLYAQHREAMTGAILAAAPDGGRACFLGAGNANDLDLARLAAHFDELHLVDIDRAALDHAARRQTAAVRLKLNLHGGLDLSGLLHRLDETPITTFADAEAALEPATRAILQALPGAFDLTVSCCIATQLHFGLTEAVPPGDAMRASILQAGQVIHLRTLLELLRPGCRALLVNDLVSTASYPVDHLPEGDLLREVEALPEKAVVFDASNPILIRRVLRRDVRLRALADATRLSDAWIWTGPRDLTYLVYAMEIPRKTPP